MAEPHDYHLRGHPACACLPEYRGEERELARERLTRYPSDPPAVRALKRNDAGALAALLAGAGREDAGALRRCAAAVCVAAC
jgi:hypothetical protein